MPEDGPAVMRKCGCHPSRRRSGSIGFCCFWIDIGLPDPLGRVHTNAWHFDDAPPMARMNRWGKAGVLERFIERLQAGRVVRVKVEPVPPDRAIVKVHPDGTGALGRTGSRPSGNPGEAGQPGFVWLPRMRRARWASRPGRGRRPAHRTDAGCRRRIGRHLRRSARWSWTGPARVTETRRLVPEPGWEPVVPPDPNRKTPRGYGRAVHAKRNEVARQAASGV